MNASKIVYDAIHKHMQLDEIQLAVIDTPEFQRLRNIKRLGVVHLVYPCAIHTQFDHSIGVSYLAGEVLESITKCQENLNITSFHIRCLKIAALCYALGSGPYNQFFDEYFACAVDKQLPNAETGCDPSRLLKSTADAETRDEWRRSTISKEMFNRLVKENQLCHDESDSDEDSAEIKEEVGDKQHLSKMECRLIRKLIMYDVHHNLPRNFEKFRFLFELLHDTEAGIDVKMWDALERDTHFVGVKNSFDFHRSIKLMEIRPRGADHANIPCFRDKEVENILEMIHTHHRMHRHAYKHKTCIAIEMKLLEVLRAVSKCKHFTFIGAGDEEMTLYEIIKTKDMGAYSQLTDNIWALLQFPKVKHDCLEKARKIMVDIAKRKIPKYIGEVFLNDDESFAKIPQTPLDFAREVCDFIPCPKYDGVKEKITPEKIMYKIVTYQYKRGGGNRLEKIQFFTKSDASQTRTITKDQISRGLPEDCGERTMNVYVEPPSEFNTNELVDVCRSAILEAFTKWCEVKKLSVPKNSMGFTTTLCNTEAEPYNDSTSDDVGCDT